MQRSKCEQRFGHDKCGQSMYGRVCECLNGLENMIIKSLPLFTLRTVLFIKRLAPRLYKRAALSGPTSGTLEGLSRRVFNYLANYACARQRFAPEQWPKSGEWHWTCSLWRRPLGARALIARYSPSSLARSTNRLSPAYYTYNCIELGSAPPTAPIRPASGETRETGEKERERERLALWRLIEAVQYVAQIGLLFGRSMVQAQLAITITRPTRHKIALIATTITSKRRPLTEKVPVLMGARESTPGLTETTRCRKEDCSQFVSAEM